MSPYYYLDAAAATSTVTVDGEKLQICAGGILDVQRPLFLTAGPFAMSMSYGEAIEIGTELIRLAHHHQAACAEFKQAQADAAATAAGQVPA